MFRKLRHALDAATKLANGLTQTTKTDARGRRGSESIKRRTHLLVDTLDARVTPATLVATSYFDSAIYEFDSATGDLEKTLVAPYSSPLLSGPAGVTLGPDQNLYISSQFNNAILQYNLSTDTLSTFIPASVLQPIAATTGNAQFAPSGLAFGPDGDLYVTLNGGQSSFSGGSVVRFDVNASASGNLTYGNTSTIVGTGMIQPSSLTFGANSGDETNLYVSNSAVGSVVKIGAATSPAPTATTFIASHEDGLEFPAGLSWGQDGNLYVVDLGAVSNQGNIYKFSQDGSTGTVISPTAPAPGNLLFQFPSSIAFDGKGHMLGANLGPSFPPNLSGSINQYNLDGSFIQNLVSSADFPDQGFGFSGISASQLLMLPDLAPLVATSFFDSAIYQLDAKTGAVQKTLVAPYSSALLSGPAGVAVGPDRQLYISSQFNNSILRYDFATDTLSTFLSSAILQPIADANGNAQFAPSGIAFGSDGNLYVSLNGGQSSFSGGAVIRFDVHLEALGITYSGTSATVASGLIQPSSVTFGRNDGDTNNLYVSNSVLDTVVKVTSATSEFPVASTFIVGSTFGLNFPAGLTWGPDGKLYVVDLGATSNQGNVFQFSANGQTGSVITPTAPGAPGNLLFSFPSAAIFDGRGHLLTANLGPSFPPNLSGSINQYNANGTFRQTFVSSGAFPDNGSGISGFAPSQLAFLPPAAPLLATSFFDSGIYKFNPRTGAKQTLVTPYTSPLLSGPAGLTVGPDRNLYISSQFNDAILKYDTVTDTLSTFISSPELLAIAQANGNVQFAPSGIRFGPDNNLYVALNGGQSSFSGGAVIRFTINVAPTGLTYAGTSAAVATGLIQPSAITFGVLTGDTGSLYVSNSILDTVVKVAAATSATPVSSTFITGGTPETGNLNFPAGLTWGDDGNFYVVDLGATSNQGNVLKFDADGDYIATVTPTAPGAPGNLLFQFPSAVLFDDRGSMLTANLGPSFPPTLSGSIFQYDSNGVLQQSLIGSGQFPSTGPGTSGIAPSQLAAAPADIKDTTNTTGNATPSPSVYGQAVAFTVTVAANGTLGGAPTGSITFTIDGLSSTTVPLTGNQATLNASALSAGSHTIVATYNGDSHFATSNHTFQQTVTPAPTSTILTATPNATTGGMLVTFTATVSPSPGADGTVTFRDGVDAIAGGSNVPVVGGVAAFTTTVLLVGSHPIAADYSGANFGPSTSNTINFVVTAAPPIVVAIAPNGNIASLDGDQRSRVASLKVTFDQAVELDEDALSLALHANAVVYDSVAQPDGYGSLPTELHFETADNVTWIVTFVGNTDDGEDGFESIKDGVYDLNIDAQKVHPFGVPGVSMAADSTETFHRTFGDFDGASTPDDVDFQSLIGISDNFEFRSTFNNLPDYNAAFDFDGDGQIGIGDNFAFRSRFNKPLTWSV